jgi:hypothetical protein
MKITFYTDEFERSHGKLPKGYGYWAFKATYIDIGRVDGGIINHEQEGWFAATGTLAEAKRQAKAFYSMMPHAKGAECWVDILP